MTDIVSACVLVTVAEVVHLQAALEPTDRVNDERASYEKSFKLGIYGIIISVSI